MESDKQCLRKHGLLGLALSGSPPILDVNTGVEMDQANRRRKDVGARLSAARRKARLSQGDVGKDMDVTRQTVSSWERGESVPSAIQLAELAMAYGACAHTLLFGQSFYGLRHEDYAELMDSIDNMPHGPRERCRMFVMATCGSLNKIGQPDPKGVSAADRHKVQS